MTFHQLLYNCGIVPIIWLIVYEKNLNSILLFKLCYEQATGSIFQLALSYMVRHSDHVPLLLVGDWTVQGGIPSDWIPYGAKKKVLSSHHSMGIPTASIEKSWHP